MIRDHRGKIPNFIFNDRRLKHQPTGLTVPLWGTTNRDLRVAMIKLKGLIHGLHA